MATIAAAATVIFNNDDDDDNDDNDDNEHNHYHRHRHHHHHHQNIGRNKRFVSANPMNHLGAPHGSCQIHRRDVPTSDDQIIRAHKREHGRERHVYILMHVASSANSNRGRLSHRPVVVGRFRPLLCLPAQTKLVGKNASRCSAAVVATPSNQHDANLWHFSCRSELVVDCLWAHDLKVYAVFACASGGGDGAEHSAHCIQEREERREEKYLTNEVV